MCRGKEGKKLAKNDAVMPGGTFFYFENLSVCNVHVEISSWNIFWRTNEFFSFSKIKVTVALVKKINLRSLYTWYFLVNKRTIRLNDKILPDSKRASLKTIQSICMTHFYHNYHFHPLIITKTTPICEINISTYFIWKYFPKLILPRMSLI